MTQEVKGWLLALLKTVIDTYTHIYIDRYTPTDMCMVISGCMGIGAASSGLAEQDSTPTISGQR